ncbi:hypothetical protein BH11GEM2_BH11GEM2_39730 [soil metagenome]
MLLTGGYVSFKAIAGNRPALIGFAAGAAYGLAARFVIARDEFGNGIMAMTIGFLFLVPLAIGYLTVRPVRGASVRFQIFAPWGTCALVVLGAIVTGLEGAICVVFAAPAMLVLSSLGGMVGGMQGRRVLAAELPVLLLLPWASMGLEHRAAAPLRHVVTSTSIEIAASPAVIWPLVVSVDSIRPAERHRSLFTAIGFPEPIAATLDHPGIGGVRTASFERGVVFHEAVIAWEPLRRIQFTIDATSVPSTALDAHVTIGGPYFDVLTGTYELQPISATRTLLVLRSEHRVSTHFNPYAEWWADHVMASIQRNILHILRDRAERTSVSSSAARRRETDALIAPIVRAMTHAAAPLRHMEFAA